MDSIGLIMALIKSMSHGVGKDGKSAYQYAVEGGYTGTEAEFAAKLAQEKFANPNALTFTGAVTGSYDGSEAVTVEIPSGGGSGELDLSVLGWKTYQTITVSGDDISSVKFTDFTVAFKECGFLQKSVAGTSIGLQYKINGKPIADNFFYNFQAAARCSEIFFTCAGIDGKYCVEFNWEHTSVYNAGEVNQLIRSTVPVQTINSVEVFPRSAGNYFANGCEFTLVYR